jgi:hypothetical protein
MPGLAGLPTCPEIPNLNSGAAVGPLTISGYVKDSAGTRIIGARVDLSGSAEAVRFTDFSGGYVFHVCPGSYTLRAQGDCTLDPTSVNLDNLTVNATQDFTGSGMSCVTGTPFSVHATGELIQVLQAGTALGLTGTGMLQGSSSTAAQAYLLQIAQEQPQAANCAVVVAGNPAIERQVLVTPPPPQILYLALTNRDRHRPSCGSIRKSNLCGGSGHISCADYCLCEIVQTAGTASDATSALYACQNQVTLADPTVAGFCYVDTERTDASGASDPLGSDAVVADCGTGMHRKIRFVGPDTPLSNGIMFISCAS